MSNLDLDEVFNIGREIKEFKIDENFESFWNKEQLQNWIKSKSDVLLVAKEKEKIVGFILIAVHNPTQKATIENIWVHENYRKNGIANKLVAQGLNQLKEKNVKYICALAKVDNLVSIKFFEKNNFSKGYDFTWLHKKI